MWMETRRKKKTEKKREIPPEIIVEEILWRLPVKALARFRSVCKNWNSIIASDPKFAILQLKNSSTTTSTITTSFDHRQRVMLWDNHRFRPSAFLLEKNENQSLTSYNNDNSEFAVTKKINPGPIGFQNSPCCSIVASCDGLVCIFDQIYNSLLFWNPLTGKTKRVSDPPNEIPPFSNLSTFGLGYDSSTDDYKLVCINGGGMPGPTLEVGVFSLRTNSWRRIQGFPIMLCSLTVPGVFINGALYFTGFCKDLHFNLVSLCLEKEKYRLLNLPVTNLRLCTYFPLGLQVLGDNLALCHPSNVDGSYRLLLINPCENSESWTKRTFTLPDDDLSTPLCQLENFEEVLFQVRGNQFGVYSFRDGTFRHLQTIGLPKKFRAITFSESLISPNTFKGRGIDIKSMAIEEEGTRKGKI